MPNRKNAVVLVVITILAVALIFSLYSIPAVFARISKGPISCTPTNATRGGEGSTIKQIRCCQTETDSTTGVSITYCTYCDDTDPPSNCGPRYVSHGGDNPTVGPTQSGNGLPSTGATNNGQTGLLPGHLGTVQSPSTPPPSLNAIPPPARNENRYNS
jgi:hypothetical protein